LINQLYEMGARKAVPHPPTSTTLAAASKIFFAVFSRYGDTLISIRIIRELMESYPNMEILVFTPPQMVPYFRELLPTVKTLAMKKRNPWNVARGLFTLGNKRFDIGYNPWSAGHESCYFISRCRYFSCYKSHPLPAINTSNLYEMLRLYMSLPTKAWHVQPFTLANDYRHILLCPQTTNPEKDLDIELLENTATILKERYPNATMTIAAMDTGFFLDGYDAFQFKKSADSSRRFIDLMKTSDLVICADSAPMHLATIMDKDNVAFFFSTNPEVVMNSGVRSIVLELDKTLKDDCRARISQTLASITVPTT
jgi:ADP-heptose:LPS heptosyltransferase